MIDQILCNSSYAAQLINWLAVHHVWSNTQLTKCVLHLYCSRGTKLRYRFLDVASLITCTSEAWCRDYCIKLLFRSYQEFVSSWICQLTLPGRFKICCKLHTYIPLLINILQHLSTIPQFSALMLLVGQQEGHMSYKKLDAMLMVTIDWSFAHLRAPVDITTSIILRCSNKIQNGDIPVQAHLEKWPLKWRECIGPSTSYTPSFLVVTTKRPPFALGGVVY